MTHRMNVMSPAAGHDVLEWDPVDELSTEAVKEKFDALVQKGYLGFADGQVLNKFDPTVAELTMSPVVTAG